MILAETQQNERPPRRTRRARRKTEPTPSGHSNLRVLRALRGEIVLSSLAPSRPWREAMPLFAYAARPLTRVETVRCAWVHALAQTQQNECPPRRTRRARRKTEPTASGLSILRVLRALRGEIVLSSLAPSRPWREAMPLFAYAARPLTRVETVRCAWVHALAQTQQNECPPRRTRRARRKTEPTASGLSILRVLRALRGEIVLSSLAPSRPWREAMPLFAYAAHFTLKPLLVPFLTR